MIVVYVPNVVGQCPLALVSHITQLCLEPFHQPQLNFRKLSWPLISTQASITFSVYPSNTLCYAITHRKITRTQTSQRSRLSEHTECLSFMDSIQMRPRRAYVIYNLGLIETSLYNVLLIDSTLYGSIVGR